MKQLRGNWGREKISHTWGKALRVWMVQGVGWEGKVANARDSLGLGSPEP